MIDKQTVQSLELKNHTIKSCSEMFHELSKKYKTSIDLEQAIIRVKPDPEFLNKIWWVLNYHSDIIDNNRKLRAIVESKLDTLANQKTTTFS